MSLLIVMMSASETELEVVVAADEPPVVVAADEPPVVVAVAADEPPVVRLLLVVAGVEGFCGNMKTIATMIPITTTAAIAIAAIVTPLFDLVLLVG